LAFRIPILIGSAAERERRAVPKAARLLELAASSSRTTAGNLALFVLVVHPPPTAQTKNGSS